MSPAPRRDRTAILLTMKPSVISDIRTETMDQSLETITRRINALGLTEPTIAFTGRGDDEILVQLPGEGDPTRAKAVIQAGGQLSLSSRRRSDLSVRGGSARGARRRSSSRHGNCSREVRKRHAGPAVAGRFTTCLDRAPIVTGQDLRDASPSPARTTPASIKSISSFPLRPRRVSVLSPSSKPPSASAWPSFSIIKVYTAPVIKAASKTPGVIGKLQPGIGAGSGAGAARRRASRLDQISRRAHRRALARRGFDSRRRSRFDRQHDRGDDFSW